MIKIESLQSLLIEMKVNGTSLSKGTAFVVRDDRGLFLVTNRHNLSGRRSDNNELMSPRTGAVPDEVVVWHNQRGKVTTWIPISRALYDEVGRPLWLEHHKWGREADVVALPIVESDQIDLYPFSVGPESELIELQVADELNIIGFPYGLQGAGCSGVWIRGTVASEPGLNWDRKPQTLIDARTRKGQSGSPVVFYGTSYTEKGGSEIMSSRPVSELVGIYSHRLSDESDLGIMWRKSVIAEVVTHGTRPETP